MEHVDQAVRIDHRRFLTLRLGDLDGQLDEVDVVALPSRVLRAEAPHAVLTRLSLIGALLAVRISADHLQPGRSGMVRGEHDPTAEVRRQVRPGHFARHGLEHNRMAFTRMRGLVLGIVDRVLALAHRTIAVPGPIQHSRVIGGGLALLVVLVARLAHGGHLHRDPILHCDSGRVGGPVALALVDDRELLPEPIHRLTDQFIRRNRRLNPALAVRQFLKIRHHIVPEVSLLDRVVHAPVAPHTRHIMVCDVAMEEEIPRQLLAETGTALRLQIESF
ncbi:MAG: hypothetical protein JW394_0641 [Nitrospira sp.]|nr:hypothetical protein [Nitrospira sp.]